MKSKASLIRISDGKSLDAEIKKVLLADFDGLEGSKRFKFDWTIERRSDVYKITLISDSDKILGLIMIESDPELKRVHIGLLESNISNQGSKKEIDRIAGCLIAFAASVSIEIGYNGYISLEPKDRLVSLYRDKYGFEEVGYLMISELVNSTKLINKYLYDEEE